MADAPAAKRHKASAALAVLNDAIASEHSPAQQVLSGELLQKIGSYLDVRSLVSAAATNSHFHAALTMEVAWHNSRWAPTPNQFLDMTDARDAEQYELSFLRVLHHLVIPITTFWRPWPALPALRSLDTRNIISKDSLQHMPQLEALTLRSGWHTDLLPALSEVPTVRSLHLEVDGHFWSKALRNDRPLFDSVPLLRHSAAIHVTFDQSDDMLPEEFPPILEALHYAQSACFYHIDAFYIQHLTAEHQDLLEARPAHSKLKKLQLDLEASMQQTMPFGVAVRRVRAMFPNLQELVLPDNLLSDVEKQQVAADCLEHNVRLTLLPSEESDSELWLR